jgi:hypothetical protein
MPNIAAVLGRGRRVDGLPSLGSHPRPRGLFTVGESSMLMDEPEDGFGSDPGSPAPGHITSSRQARSDSQPSRSMADQTASVLALADGSAPPAAQLDTALAALQLQNVANLLNDRPNQVAADRSLLALATLVAQGAHMPGAIGTVIDIFDRYGVLDLAFTGAGMSPAEFLAQVNAAIETLDFQDPDNSATEDYARDLADSLLR